MKIINGPQGSGRLTALLQALDADEELVLVVGNKANLATRAQQARALFGEQRGSQLSRRIVTPGHIRARQSGRIVVDDLEGLLQQVFGFSVVVESVTTTSATIEQRGN